MVDNVAITAGAGTSIATDDVGGVHYQINKLAFGALDTATLVSTTNPLPIVSKIVTITQTITRPANTTTYTINDALMDTAATAGGDTVTGAAAASGGAGTLTDVIFAFDEDAATPLTGEIYLFDSAFTTIADNAAFAISDADARLLVGVVPFALRDIGNNGFYHAQGLSYGFTCIGSANLRSAIRVTNGYVPTTNSSVLTIRYKIIQT